MEQTTIKLNYPASPPKEEFTLRAEDMMELHGVHQSTITQWIKRGAFMYIRRVGTRSSVYIHKSFATKSMGVIKDYMKAGLYKEPMFVLPPIKQVQAKKTGGSYQNANVLNLLNKIELLSKQVSHIEVKTDAMYKYLITQE